ncbi:MAG: cation-transporting P-type ATPase [Bacillota bacterium]
MCWHQKDTGQVVEDLRTSLKGISQTEAQRRLNEYGPNELKEKKTP